MTVIKPALDLFIDANILLVLAYCLWRVAQAIIQNGPLKSDHTCQLVLLKSVFALTLISPLLAHAGVLIGNAVFPNTPLTLSDIAVAAYLRGDIALPAADFETMLKARRHVTMEVLMGQYPWVTALIGLLVAGSFVQLVRLIRSAARLHNAIEGSYLWRRTQKVDIRISDTVFAPFAGRGVFRRHIVLPSRLLTHPREMRLVLAHEFQHLRSGDVEWEVAFEVLRPLFYWNPAFVLWKRAFDHMRELSCDQAVMLTRQISPSDYAQCLLEFCERRLTDPMPKKMTVAFVSAGAGTSRRAFEARLMAICDGTKSQKSGLILPIAAVLLGIGLALAAASVRQPADWSQDRLMLSTIVNLERLELINRGY